MPMVLSAELANLMGKTHVRMFLVEIQYMEYIMLNIFLQKSLIIHQVKTIGLNEDKTCLL